MRLFQVRYFPEAKEAIGAAYHDIARRDGVGRADGWLDAFTQSIDKLEHEALTWPVVATRRGLDIRSKLCLVHRVYYRVNEATATVWILDTAHTARESKLEEYRDPQ